MVHSHTKQSKIIIFFIILSDEVSVFIFASPCTTYTVCSTCSSAILIIICSIKSYVRISITNKIITPEILMAYAPARTLVGHN